jgi:DNA-binding NtrC family response regulator
MTMPNLTGDKLAAALIQIRPRIPIVLCTGYSRIISEEKAAAIGIKAFAMKPLTIEDLSNTIRRVLDQAQTSDPQ